MPPRILDFSAVVDPFAQGKDIAPVKFAVRGHGGSLLLAWTFALAAFVTLGGNAAPQFQPEHNGLLAADPAPNAMLADGPDHIALTFSDPVDPRSVWVRLLGTDVQETTLGAVEIDPQDPRRVTVRPVGLLGGDEYVVIWSARTASDGKLLAGAYPFRSGVIQNPGAAQLADQWPAPWATLLRWLVFLGTALAIGGFGWSRLLTASADARATRSVWRGGMMSGGALVAFFASLLPPIFEWRLASGSIQAATLVASLQSMPLGWWVQFVTLFVLVVLCLAALVRERASAPLPAALDWSGLGLGLATLLGLSFTTHAAAARHGAALALEIAHQWSSALWLSALLYLAAGWRGLGSDVGRFRTVRWVGGALFAISVLTGLARAWPQTTLGALILSPYGQVLAGKSVVVLVILALGLVALVVPRRASVLLASGSLGAQGLVALIAALFAAILALMATPGTTAPVTLAGVELVEVVPLDARVFGTDSGVVHFLTQPGTPGVQSFVVRVTNDSGAPLAPGPHPEAQVDLTPLTGPGDLETAVRLQPDPSGALFSAAAPLARSGWWQASVVITPPGGIASRVRFWFVLPDPNLRGRGPDLTIDPAARAIFTRGLTSLTALRSVRISQRLNDGAGSLVRSRTAVSRETPGQPASFAETAIDAAGSVVSQQRILGDQRWILRREEGWIEAEPMPFQTPADWNDAYVDATGFQLGPREEVDGELCQVVTFWRPPNAGSARAPAWFAWWVGLASGEVRREASVSSDSYAVNDYSDFDARLDISVPATPAPPAPAATPQSVGATPVAAQTSTD